MRPGRLKITVQLAADGDRLQCRERPAEAGVLLYIEAGVLLYIEAGVLLYIEAGVLLYIEVGVYYIYRGRCFIIYI